MTKASTKLAERPERGSSALNGIANNTKISAEIGMANRHCSSAILVLLLFSSNSRLVLDSVEGASRCASVASTLSAYFSNSVVENSALPLAP